MLRIEDAVDRAFTRTHVSDGYEIAEVDEFCSDVVEAITMRDEVIGDLQSQLVEARTHLADARAVRAHPDGNRRESSGAAARLLERAAVTADQLVTDAQAEVDSLMAAAHAEAEQLADRKAGLETKVESLRQLESEHRNRLRRQFTEQLAQLEGDRSAVLRAVAAD